MHYTAPAFACAISVTLADETCAYASLADAVTANAIHIARAIRARDRSGSRGEELRIQACRWAGFTHIVDPSTPELEFTDEVGFAIPTWLVEATFVGLGLPVEHVSRFRRRRPHVFRYGPVPGIHKRYGGRNYRSPVTTNERRASGILVRDEEARELGIAPRKARTGYELPSSYDDVRRTVQRSWKAQRRTQWKR